MQPMGGLWGYLRLRSWFTRTLSRESMRGSAITTTAKCKHEYEISGTIECWQERYRILKEEDNTTELPGSWKMTALRSMLCVDIQNNIEYREQEFKSYDDIRAVVMRWANNKKIEEEKSLKGLRRD